MPVQPWFVPLLYHDRDTDEEEDSTTEAGTEQGGGDTAALVRTVLREAYEQQQADLRLSAERVRRHNAKQKAIRDYLGALWKFEGAAAESARERGLDPCDPDDETRRALTRLFNDEATDYARDAAGEVECVPVRVPPRGVGDFVELAREIGLWEDRLKQVTDAGEPASRRLHDLLERQGECQRLVSHIEKILIDTAISAVSPQANGEPGPV